MAEGSAIVISDEILRRSAPQDDTVNGTLNSDLPQMVSFLQLYKRGKQ